MLTKHMFKLHSRLCGLVFPHRNNIRLLLQQGHLVFKQNSKSMFILPISHPHLVYLLLS